MRRIAITNQKGGVGKTTTTANLGAALALLGRRVIVVDLDPQANLTLHLLGDRATPEHSTYSLLRGESSFAETLVRTELPLLRLAPASVDLAGAEVELANSVGRETILRDAIEVFRMAARESAAPALVAPDPSRSTPPEPADAADFLLFDCPPSLGVLSLNALVAAREVFIPLQTQFLALQGVSRLIEVVDLVRKRLNPSLAITGVVACMVNPRTNLAVEVLEEIRSFFGARLFDSRIRENVRLAEAPSHGKTIFSYAADSNGAADYLRFATEILERAAGVWPAASGATLAPAATAVVTPAPAPVPAAGTSSETAVPV